MKEIEVVSLVVDGKSGQDGYFLKSIELVLREPLAGAVKLMNWLAEGSVVEELIQEHVNAWYRKEEAEEDLCKEVNFKVPNLAASFTVREMFIEIQQQEIQPGASDYSLPLRLDLRGLRFR